MSNPRPEGTRMQANFKTKSGTLLNLYAEDAAMLSQQLQELEGLLSQVAAVEDVLGIVESMRPAPKAAATPVTPGDDGAPQCKHGARIHRTGNKNGRQWSAWFCPTPKGTPDQCEAQWS